MKGKLKMKRTIISISIMLIMAICLCVPAFAAEESGMVVYVTIADGELCLASAAVEVSDVDGDENLTINDALFAAHETYYKGGAEKGYESFDGDYGLAISKLWGNESGTGYGYYVNDYSAFSLADPVAKGDRITAFVYTDTVAYSDTYCFFNSAAITADKGETVELTLSAAGYDENWNPVTLPVAGAKITFNGEETEFVTDENGKVNVTFEGKKDVLISAVSDSAVLVPPVCVAEVAGADSEGADWKMIVIIGAVVIFGGYMVFKTLKNNKK